MIENKVEMAATRKTVILYVGNGGHVQVCLKWQLEMAVLNHHFAICMKWQVEMVDLEPPFQLHGINGNSKWRLQKPLFLLRHKWHAQMAVFKLPFYIE